MTETIQRNKTSIRWYILSDFLAAVFAWILLYSIRRYLLHEPLYISNHFYLNNRFWWGLLIIPLIWIAAFAITGSYNDLYRKSRLYEFNKTFVTSLIGCTGIFFAIVINDPQHNYTYYYKSYFIFIFAQLLFTWSGRWYLLQLIIRQLQTGKIRFNSLLLAPSENIRALVEETAAGLRKSGFHYIGFIPVESNTPSREKAELVCLGNRSNLLQLIHQFQISLVVIGTDNNQIRTELLLDLAESDVEIKTLASPLDILSGAVRTTHVFGTALADIKTNPMAEWQQPLKRAIDCCFSLLGLLTLSPLFVFIAFKVWRSSPGPIIFKQERIGYRGKKFVMYKFRSMIQNSEPNGPCLSSTLDHRITTWGKTMRKWRLDELPQLWNILKGEMSLIGPRPEREFFIKKIEAEQPYYKFLLKLKPGLTSWGMVKFGYAENTQQMIDRMKYDLIYLENISLALDFKIMAYTLITIAQGKGK